MTSVIIPAHNSARTLRACVESVLRSTTQAHEIIIVDDASRDHTAALAEELSREHPGVVRVIRLQTNSGPAAARNAGARIASGTFLFFLDSDTRLDADALRCFADRIREADAVCGVYASRPLNPGLVPHYKALLDHFHFSRLGVTEYDGFSACCGGVRVTAFRDVAGFDGHLLRGMDYENEDFGYRLSVAHRTLLDPAIQAAHHFPLLGSLTRTYFRRVSQWVELFLQRRKFEMAGDATASTGIATLGPAVAAAAMPFMTVWPWAIVIAAVSLLGWLAGYWGFFAFMVRTRPALLLPCVLLNGYFCIVITLGAMWGIVSYVRVQLGGLRRRANSQGLHTGKRVSDAAEL